MVEVEYLYNRKHQGGAYFEIIKLPNKRLSWTSKDGLYA